MRAAFGEGRLPQVPIAQPRFYHSFLRQFPGTTEADAERMWQLLEVMAHEQHGSMMMIASDASTEAARLSRQGMVIKPTLMTAELLRRASSIDGTILVDPFGVCHALVVIPDGLANERCTPSRGSRYNSAVRYVYSSASSRMALAGLFSSQWRRGSWRMRLRSRAARQRAFRMLEPPAARIRL